MGPNGVDTDRYIHTLKCLVSSGFIKPEPMLTYPAISWCIKLDPILTYSKDGIAFMDWDMDISPSPSKPAYPFRVGPGGAALNRKSPSHIYRKPNYCRFQARSLG